MLLLMIIIKQDLLDTVPIAADRTGKILASVQKGPGWKKREKEKWKRGEEVEVVERFPDSKI
jgi:hypothetical protein